MSKRLNITGEKYSYLTVINDGPKSRAGHRRVWCRCDCGKKSLVQLANLRSGNTKSCGCLENKYPRHNSVPPAQHNHSKRNGKPTPSYNTWMCMRRRCRDKKFPAFPDYGGRGISVCKRWDISFENFLADMGERPDGCTIDRIDVDGNYEPSNCRWATAKEQRRNQRDF